MSEQQIYVIAHIPVGYSSKLSMPRRGVEKNYEHLPDFYKIGISENPEGRVQNMSGGTPNKLELVTTIDSDNAKVVESRLHSIYGFERATGEWFKLTRSSVNSLKGLDRLDESDVEGMGYTFAEWRTETSLYVEVMKRRQE